MTTEPTMNHNPPRKNNFNIPTQLAYTIAPAAKHLIPCPFLRRKDHCLEGSLGDFSYQLDRYRRTKFSQPRSAAPPSIDPTFCPPIRSPPRTSFPFFRTHMNYPYISSQIGFSSFNGTRSPIFHPCMTYPSHLFPLMEIPTSPPHF